MSLITTCPACQTQFEVTETILQAHAGQVRCGECHYIFDGRDQLTSVEAAEVPTTAPTIANSQRLDPSSLMGLDSVPTAADTPQVDLQNIVETQNDGMNGTEVDLDIGTNESLPAMESDAVSTAPTTTDNQALPYVAMPAITADEVPDFVPAFLTQVPPSPPARSFKKKLLIALLISLCVLGLLGQALYLFRLPLLERVPAARPWLVQFCQPLHCTLSWPKQITELAIDDADIQESADRAGVLVFSSVLINHGKATLALPLIELTLTDANEVPIVRRQFKPQAYLPSPLKEADGIGPTQTIPVRLLLGVEAATVAGFRASIAYD